MPGAEYVWLMCMVVAPRLECSLSVKPRSISQQDVYEQSTYPAHLLWQIFFQFVFQAQVLLDTIEWLATSRNIVEKK